MQEQTKAGFTLIELLVVVLIIGILAAVAVPQYQKAVDKSRAMTVMSTIKAIKDAQEVYYLANGKYATDFNDLDIERPNDNDKSVYYFYIKGTDGTQSVKGIPAGLSGTSQLEYFFDHHTVTEYNPAGPYLLCTGHNQRGIDLCKALGGSYALTGGDGITEYYFL